MRNSVRFTMVPGCAVSDRTRVEMRLGVPADEDLRVEIWVAGRTVLADKVLATGPGKRLVRAWWPTAGQRGRCEVRWRVAGERTTASGSRFFEVVPSETVGLRRFGGVWVEPGAVVTASGATNPRDIEAFARRSVDAMHAAGIGFVIIAYVEAGGTWYTPVRVEYGDREGRGTAVPLPGGVGRTDGAPDVVGAILRQASRRGMGVFMGMSRGGDMHLLWEYDKPDWQERNRVALRIGRELATRLHERYGHEESFTGWYLTHEANDLAKASAYYDPIAEHCRSLGPERAVMVAPAGTPLGSRSVIESSLVDIFAWQDAVGSGYVPFVNTWNPERRMAMLPEIFARYASWHAGGDKHCWSDLEVWEMDGKSGYANPYPPAFSRVRRQIEEEACWVPVLTAYAWHGYMHPSGSAGNVDPRAEALLSEYRAYRKESR